ncbi:alpha/beta fold hydrolase [Streptomyces sp. NPDC046215]|uniref:3-oxoadipate enol-lactonase n=1 Tax=Streptomyces stramineus TaxID=173861 RepID=A0ABN0ZGM9_9ACTN
MSETKTNTLQHRFDGPEDAPVLVLGPSLGTTWHMWDRQIPELTRHWRVFRFDLPGHGGAPVEPTPDVGGLTDRLIATLATLGVDRFGYAGCSIGGAVGADLALRHPHRLASLALVATSARFGTADSWRQRGSAVRTSGLDPEARSAPERWFTPAFAAAQPAIVDWAVQMVSTTDAHCYVGACQALASFDARADLGRISVPTLVLVGSDDQVTPPADARVLVAGIPDARLAVVPSASHLAPVEQPAAVTDLLVRHFTTAWQLSTQQSLPTVGASPAGPAHTPPPAVVPPAFPQGTTPAPGAVPPAAAAPPVTPGPFAPPAAPAPAFVPGPAPAPAVFPGFGPPPSDDEPLPTPFPPPPATHGGDLHEQGSRTRREVLGDAHPGGPETADDFTGDFEDFVTRYAWGATWSRPGLDRRTRSVVTLTALTARGHLDDLAAHTRAALRNGLTPDEIKETLLHTAVYCGIPAAGAAFEVARRVIAEETPARS